MRKVVATVAFGGAFWGYAVFAEVYTLSAALLLAIMFWLVRWKQTRRDAHLYAAAACFALALGNHLAEHFGLRHTFIDIPNPV